MHWTFCPHILCHIISKRLYGYGTCLSSLRYNYSNRITQLLQCTCLRVSLKHIVCAASSAASNIGSMQVWQIKELTI